jgi:hypothetical protein
MKALSNGKTSNGNAIRQRDTTTNEAMIVLLLWVDADI